MHMERIYRLNDVIPEISLEVITSKKKEREKAGRKKSDETKKWQNVDNCLLVKDGY